MEEDRTTPGTTKQWWDSDNVTAICTLVLAIGSLGTLIFAWIQIQDTRVGTQRQISEMRDEARGQISEMREEARVQHLTELIDRFDSPAFQSIRKSLALRRVDQRSKRLRDLDADSEPFPPEFDEELMFCDHIGLLTERGYLDRHDVWYAFGQWLFLLREDARPYLETLSNPADYQKCISLVDSIRPFEEQENKGAYNHLREDDFVSYYQSDIDMLQGQPAYRRRTPTRR